MATPIRISIIGAGSAQFSLHLIKDICLTKGLAGSRVCFMDIDRERLEMVHKLATRFAGEMGACRTSWIWNETSWPSRQVTALFFSGTYSTATRPDLMTRESKYWKTCSPWKATKK